MHPWHDVEVGENAPETIQAIIEVSKGSKAKYELDKKTGLLRLDRVLFSSVHYPANYGFIPKSYCDDNDPLDILVLGQEKATSLCIVRATPIGMMKMIDQGKVDDKIIAVHTDDPEYMHYRAIDDLPAHRLREIKNFFETYKELEDKEVSVEGFHDRNEALKVITEALVAYQKEKSKLIPK